MSQATPTDRFNTASAIDKLAHANLLRPDPKLDFIVANSKKNNLPEITVSPLQGAYLGIQARIAGAKSVLEIGTLGGYSTLHFVRAGARVTSIEISERHQQVARQNLAEAGVTDAVEFVLGAALDVLPRLAREGRTFDLVFIDADWAEQHAYFDWAVRLASGPGACVYVDNAVRALLEYEGAVEGAIESLITRVGRDERVSATLVPTVSSHKMGPENMFDGFLLAVVL
ncbi:S-adenosyl-L-methionine-dependent methyltransferase [Biscogniauxia mediterranea]|nr:S-adenosyl-L-methionine-dependent methyltransferase [Biscogniauxia mediterranea]